MNEESSINPSSAPDETDTDVVSLLKRMQQQLSSLERKIDLLISNSREGSSGETPSDGPFRKRSFSKPFRSFDHPRRHGKGGHAHSPRERDSAQGHFYEHRPHEKNRGSGPRKRPFSFKPKDRK
jgi:hypothetical protein